MFLADLIGWSCQVTCCWNLIGCRSHLTGSDWLRETSAHTHHMTCNTRWYSDWLFDTDSYMSMMVVPHWYRHRAAIMDSWCRTSAAVLARFRVRPLGGASCAGPSGPTGRSSGRRTCTGMVWRRCACDNGAWVRRTSRSATRTPPTCTCTASLLKIYKHETNTLVAVDGGTIILYLVEIQYISRGGPKVHLLFSFRFAWAGIWQLLL